MPEQNSHDTKTPLSAIPIVTARAKVTGPEPPAPESTPPPPTAELTAEDWKELEKTVTVRMSNTFRLRRLLSRGLWIALWLILIAQIILMIWFVAMPAEQNKHLLICLDRGYNLGNGLAEQLLLYAACFFGSFSCLFP